MHGSTTLRLHKLSRNMVVRKVKTKELIKSPNSLQLDLNKHSIFIVICMEVSYIDMTVTANLQPESPPNCKHCFLTPFLLPTHTRLEVHTWRISSEAQSWPEAPTHEIHYRHRPSTERQMLWAKQGLCTQFYSPRKDPWRTILHIHGFWDQKELQCLQLIIPAHRLSISSRWLMHIL